jgi:hypothetical protein
MGSLATYDIPSAGHALRHARHPALGQRFTDGQDCPSLAGDGHRLA